VKARRGSRRVLALEEGRRPAPGVELAALRAGQAAAAPASWRRITSVRACGRRDTLSPTEVGSPVGSFEVRLRRPAGLGQKCYAGNLEHSDEQHVSSRYRATRFGDTANVEGNLSSINIDLSFAICVRLEIDDNPFLCFFEGEVRNTLE
jgi:hypothetical protein